MSEFAVLQLKRLNVQSEYSYNNKTETCDLAVAWWTKLLYIVSLCAKCLASLSRHTFSFLWVDAFCKH